jgi:hypothetical protein
MSEPYNIEIVNYDTFYNELPTKRRKLRLLDKHLFALVNPVTKSQELCLTPILYISPFKEVPISDILKHEQIHIGHSRRPMETHYLNLKIKSLISPIKMKLWHLLFQ